MAHTAYTSYPYSQPYRENYLHPYETFNTDAYDIGCYDPAGYEPVIMHKKQAK